MSSDLMEPQTTTEAPAPAATAPHQPQGDLAAAFHKVLHQPQFIIAAVVLLVAALGINFVMNAMKLYFKKEPVALSHELATIPARIGTWVQVTQDTPLDSEMQDVLGTDKYIFRDYVNEAVVGNGVAERFRDKDAAWRRQELGNIRSKYANAVVSLSVTYYTGMVDTVAHVPDRCVTADGYEPTSYETVKWPIARDLPTALRNGSDDIELRYINFEDQTGTSNVPRSISYFFHVNGEFNSSPLGVRSKLANLLEKKAYYAKIETMTTIKDPQLSQKVQTDFLAGAMPEILRCMPDWDKEHGRPSRTAVAAR